MLKLLKRKLLPVARKSKYDANVDVCADVWNEIHGREIDSLSGEQIVADEEESEDEDGDDVADGVAALTIEPIVNALADAHGDIDNVDFDELLERRKASKQRRESRRSRLVSPCEKCGDVELILRPQREIELHIRNCKGK